MFALNIQPKPTPLAIAWSSFSAKVIPADAPDLQRREMRRAFYAGASAALSAMVNIGVGSPLNRQDRIEGVLAESADFGRQVQAGTA